MGERTPITARFLGKIKQSESTGCWLWTKHITKAGYAKFSAYGEAVSGHRFAYEHFVGPIPAGMTIDHNCHTSDPTCVGGSTCLHRRCVNPGHLVPMPGPENTSLAYPARKTHCKFGHPFDEVNTKIIMERGVHPKRRCRKCLYNRKNAHRSAKRAAARAVKPPKQKPTHCRHGHPYVGDNIYVVQATGSWQCKACNKARDERRTEQRRQARLDALGGLEAAA